MPSLRCHATIFYSQLDESLFFDALRRISAVKKIEGRGQDLFLSVPSRMSDKALGELIALFYRYKVDMRQLAPFIAKGRGSWFRNSKAYWSKRVSPKKKRSS
jgi:hypothetical protein